MVKGYTIFYQSAAYNSSLNDVVNEKNWEVAMRRLLRKEQEMHTDRIIFEYYIFDVTEIKLHLHDDYIEFEISSENIDKYFVSKNLMM